MSIASVGEDSKFAKYLNKQIEKKLEDEPESTSKSVFDVFGGGNSGNGIGSSIVNYAKKFLGCNEADGSADKFLGGGSSSATAWCAAFVKYVVEHVMGGKAPSWYKNVGNKWYCPDIGQAAESAKKTVSASKAKPGDIVLFQDGGGGYDRFYHIGIVKSNKGGKITTIEGNSSDQVKSNSYSVNDSRLTICKMA